MTTLFTKDDIKEIASQLLGTSPNHIVLRTKLGFKGEVIECIDKVLFIVQSDNAYSKIVAEGENYKLERSYKDRNFYLRGEGVWLPDGLGFFCDYAKFPDNTIYIECTRI